MKITYRISFEEYVRLQKLRYKRGHDLSGGKWIIRILGFLIFQCMISTAILIMTFNYVQNIPTLKIFLISDLIFIALMLYFSRRISDHLFAKRCKDVNFNSDRILEIQEDCLTWEDMTFSMKYPWSYFKAIERFEEYVILKLKASSIVLPIKAFDSEQEAGDFVKLARTYKQNAGTVGNSDSHKKPVSKKALIFLSVCLAIIFLPSILMTIGSKHNFWSQVFRDGDPQVLYLETTEGFKSRISKEQWEGLVSQWRNRLGPWKKTRTVSFHSYNCNKFPDKSTKPSEHFNSVRKTKCKVIGSKGVAYITTYEYSADHIWKMNGFEIVFETAERESYLFDKDVKFVEARE